MSRDYVFTSWKQPEFDRNEFKYICWGKERCPDTDREHYQGFGVFVRTHRIPSAKRLLGAGGDAHFEVRRGTREQAREYCRKDGEFFEWGELGKRTISDLLKKGCLTTIKNEDPLFYVRYHRGLEKLLLDAKQRPSFRFVEVTWLWGPTGVGKTRKVMEMDNVYKLDSPYVWFDGYEEEDILLIDDYENNVIPRGFMLNLLDGYKLRLATKGGHCWANWTKVFITSNESPECYSQWDDAMARRVSDKCRVRGVILTHAYLEDKILPQGSNANRVTDAC